MTIEQVKENKERLEQAIKAAIKDFLLSTKDVHPTIKAEVVIMDMGTGFKRTTQRVEVEVSVNIL